MKNLKMKSLLVFFSIMLLQAPAIAQQAATDSQLKAIEEMGRLNGVALQCRLMPQMQRIKRELVLKLPKQRALGDWFERKTNASFLAFMKNASSCPSAGDFDQQLDKAISQLESEFKQ